MCRLLIGMLVVALASSACATAPGQPVPAPGDATTPPPTSESQSGDAPPINSPELDLANYENRVCDLLTPNQVSPFAVSDPGKPKGDVVGPVCTWSPPDSTAGAVVSVAILSKVGYGWDGIYERKDRWEFFEDAGEINGYPAVHRDTGDATNGRCQTTVGVRRDVVFDVLVQVNVRGSAEYRNPCALSDRAASSVVDTLKNGGR